MKINLFRLREVLREAGHSFTKFTSIKSVSGGSIHHAWQITDQENQSIFVKTNALSHQKMFETEFAGLKALAATQTLRIPRPLLAGKTGKFSFLATEWLELSGIRDGARLGKELAQLHRHHGSKFGGFQDNFIGSTPQSNKNHADWCDFWREERLLPMLKFAKKRGFPPEAIKKGKQLAFNLDPFFEDYSPAASLVHGDLWGGNASSLSNGEPVIYDPAVYYGDREVDIAMSELFGSFGSRFWTAYHATYPIDPGYKKRRELYNLYHILNHYHLFGGSYRQQSANTISNLLRLVS